VGSNPTIVSILKEKMPLFLRILLAPFILVLSALAVVTVVALIILLTAIVLGITSLIILLFGSFTVVILPFILTFAILVVNE